MLNNYYPQLNIYEECNVTRAHALMSASPAPAYASAEEDGAGPSVVVVESDSAGPSATVTEVRNMVVLESKVNAVEDYSRSE